MAEFEFINYEEYENWLAVVVGLAVTVEGLQDYCHSKLDFIQNTIKNIVSNRNLPTCVSNCSKTKNPNGKSWCNTCFTWRQQLETFNKDKRQWNEIKWSKINSKDWETNHQEIAKIFLRQIPDSPNLLEDLSAILSLFRNCVEFKVAEQLIVNVTTVRNRYYGHCFKLKLTSFQKQICLDILKALLNIKPIAVTKSAQRAVRTIEHLNLVHHISKDIIDKKTRSKLILLVNHKIDDVCKREHLRHSDIKNYFNDKENDIDYLRKRMDDFGTMQSARHNLIELLRLANIKICLFVSILLLTYILLPHGKNNQQKEIMKGKKADCLSLHFNEFGASDWDFFYEVRTLFVSSVVKRMWLKNLIQRELNQTENGVLLTSDMGFGKSAMVADIVCSRHNSIWYEIKKKVLSYHLCQYDVEMTREPTVFIRNIAAMLSKRYKFINETIRSDNITDLFIFGTHCSRDPMGCFDRLVLKPLKFNEKLLPDYDLLIVLDAADECQTLDGKKDIVSIISQRISQLPSQVKFLVTSRDLKSVQNKLTDLRIISMHSFSNEIIEDSYAYVRYKTENVRSDEMQRLVTLSNGSFLFLKLYMDSCLEGKVCFIEKSPDSLFKLYRANLERIFGVNGEYFPALAKGLFEVLCAAKKPLTLETMINVSSLSKDIEHRSAEQFVKNEIRHFLHVSRGRFSLIHKSLKEFFLSLSQESPFYIDIKNGHKKLGQYYMDNIHNADMSLVGLAFHVANSLNLNLERKFISLYEKADFKISKHLLMHEVAEKVNSYFTANLISKLFSKYSTDHRNKNNETAAFIAASHGNVDTLQWLLDNGADVNFEKDRSHCRNVPKYDLVEECKHVYFCGYNLLEIASQNGHTNTVVLLLKENVNLKHKTLFGLTALDLAFEKGHNLVINHLLRSKQTFLSQYSLFKASENGHVNTVRLLLQLGVHDSCVPCNSTLYWLNSNELRVQQIHYRVSNIFEPPKLRFMDDWQLIVCESALHAAVRNCHVDVIKVLLREKGNAVECPDRSGMTPILSSVKYNCSRGSEMLIKGGANIKMGCRNMSSISQFDVFSEKEKRRYESYICPRGAKIAHVLAMFYNLAFLKTIMQNDVSLLDVKDNKNLTPLHYSNCAHGIGLSSMAPHPKLRKYFDLRARSRNGSTPYHSAAYCKSYVGHIVSYFPDWLSKNATILSFNHGIPDVVDHAGRSIIHYFFLGVHNSQFDFIFLRMYFENKLNFSRTDKYGKNCLHYAVKSKSILQIVYIFDRIPVAERKEILMKTDIYGNTPLSEAFRSLPPNLYVHGTYKNPYDIRLPNCSLFDVFYEECKANFSFLLQPAENFNLDMILMYHNYNISSVNVTDLMYIAAKKSSLYSILMLYTYYHSEFVDVVSNSNHVFNLLHLFRGPFLSFIILLPFKSILRCNKSFDSYPFAAIVMNYEEYFWTLSNKNSFDFYLKNETSSELDVCFDSEGYNLLHRAAIGGNSFALKYLVKKGMNISTLTKQNETLLDLIVKHSFYTENGKYSEVHRKIERMFTVTYYNNSVIEKTIYTNSPGSICNYDTSANFILMKISNAQHWNKTQWKAKFCQPKVRRLGFVHLAAAKGLYGFISTAYNIFGRRVINCFDQHDVSPYYLAKVNDQQKLVEWFKEQKFKLRSPQKWVIPIIAYLYSVNFKPIVKKPRNCRWSVLKPSKFNTKPPYHICFNVNMTSEGTKISLPYYGILRHPTQFIPNYFGQWIKWIWHFRIRANSLKRLLNETCLLNHYSNCSQIVKEFGLHFQGANLASRLLYQNLQLFKGNHITYWASYTLMFNTTIRLPSLEKLYGIIFSDQLKYLTSLKMSEERHEHWLNVKLGDIQTHNPMAEFLATGEMDRMDTRFLENLFRYYQMFHFRVLKYPYYIAYQDFS